MNAELKPLKQSYAVVSKCEEVLLALLAERHGQVVNHKDIITALYGSEYNQPYSNCIEVFIGRIRRKRLQPYEKIETVRKQGYVYTYNRGAL